jgi:hypothetical protein
MHCQIDEVVRNIEPRRARIPDLIEILLARREGTGIDCATTREENESVEESNDVRARLMNGENDGAVICLGQGYQAFDHVECVVCIL